MKKRREEKEESKDRTTFWKSSPRFYPGTKTKPGSQFSLIYFSGESKILLIIFYGLLFFL
ncbi:hypothetical protein DLM78_08520 [Leptospira stimsonii]|uniref:Uncharacterized protein n=1 Tax=Leptospira stimsonii TaxID=2202203 RepID=A0A8B3CSY0_9LEPT|nr:hypothetical protein DLM78_08520 [Leptospira stimsonii]